MIRPPFYSWPRPQLPRTLASSPASPSGLHSVRLSSRAPQTADITASPAMAYPPQREAFHGPSDIASGHGHYKSPQYHSIHNDMQIGSAATPIPGMANRVNAPPPLPPPRFPMGGGDAYSFTPRQSQYNHSVSSSTASTSGYGSMEASWQSERPNFKRRDTGSSTPDSSYASTDRYAAPRRGFGQISSRSPLRPSRSKISFRHASPSPPRVTRANHFSRFPTEFGAFHTKLPLQSPAEMHGDWMKKKLNTARLSDQSGSSLSASLDILRKSNPEKRAPPMLNMPIHSRSVLDSPGRMSDAPVFSAVSPRIGPFSRELDRSRESSDAGSPRHRRRNNSDDASVVHGQYELGSVEDMDMDDGPSLRRLQIDEATRFGAGQKRRAESPAGVSPPFQGTRGSPTPRLTIAPVSSMPSYSSGPSRETSYMSASTAPSIITNFGRRSPGAVSPGAISPTSSNSPYNAPMSLNPSPRGSISQRLAAHVPLAQEPPPMRKEIKSGKMGFLMCECCPKKPKKFETPEELR